MNLNNRVILGLIICGNRLGLLTDQQSAGKHYQIDEVTFEPKPVQRPRVPIWCAGWWPRKAPFRRAARYDGVFPLGANGPLTPKDIADISEFVNQHRNSKSEFDIIVIGESTSDPQKDSWIADYRDAGATWYVEIIMGDDLEKQIKRVSKGPPAI